MKVHTWKVWVFYHVFSILQQIWFGTDLYLEVCLWFMRSILSFSLFVLLLICTSSTARAEKEKTPKFTVDIHDAVLDDDPLLVQACTNVSGII